MARSTYGNFTSDQRTNQFNVPEPGGKYYLWTAPTVGQGTQITDFLGLGNNTVTSGVGTTGLDAFVWFQGPDGYDDPIYASSSLGGARRGVTGPLGGATKAFVTAAIATYAASAGGANTGGSSTPGYSVTDNGDGTFTLAGSGITDNGDGTFTIAN